MFLNLAELGNFFFRKVCNDVGATSNIHIGFIRNYVEDKWERFDSGSMDNFVFTWNPGYPANRVYLQMKCIHDDNFGTVFDYYADYKKNFICQYFD